ncbi:hypothetical protein BJV74DRAFT_800071 [Russula compacta]|nr:hypothetical protein BJV74DRAFT_800071 [Russula compacta]
MTSTPSTGIIRERGAVDGSAPLLYEYTETHQVPEIPPLGKLDLKDCQRLILFNVWTELRACLGDMARSIVKLNRVVGPQRNPHCDMWVRRDTGAALVAAVRQQTKRRNWGLPRVVTEAERVSCTTFAMAQRPGTEERFAHVQHWRLAIWQSWWERRNVPAKAPRFNSQRDFLKNIASWNINGFWSKKEEVEEFLSQQKVAVLGIQETLVSNKHYTIRSPGYRCYQSNAEEDFVGLRC